MTTKKKPTRRVRSTDRNWRRDLLARDIFTALTVRDHGKPMGPDLTDEQIWSTNAVAALKAAEQFERARAAFKPRSA